MEWTIEERHWDDPDGAALRARQRTELNARYGRDDHEPGTPPSAADIDVFLVAVARSGEAVGCGALRQLSAATAEIKRMYVDPVARGSGVATALLRTLETVAAGLGWRTLRLETGNLQPEAERFYRREGYREIPLFGGYVGSDLSICFERTLS
ncbi:GNAT family N-acetyltransferase [Amycolatopsis sp. H20-H5]|uniref:GNAT family N-acetyltransferase n=1 Tax=Amycolatopsis sp. H20-H5 TaxID=3046309 RepID=UPI002DBC44B7|nr:GNAT family N-acetyltransferase [Amycolatopsis sp. H20-H5]MEC3978104.1 GNAT family N-acetyltransferase [Amycolatopsis sp. H20-H5]